MPPPVSKAPAVAVEELPALLGVFTFHGLDLGPKKGKPNTFAATCPSCGKDGKFDIRGDSGLYSCFSCGLKGNPVEFLRWLHAASLEQTADADYEQLRSVRKLLSRETPRAWGAAKSLLTGEWILPGYSTDGRLVTLYVYRQIHSSKKPTLMVTPNPEGAECGGHALSGIPLLADLPPSAGLDICEGAWDGMAWWEVGRQTTIGKDGAGSLTADEATSYLAKRGVISCPGANVFKKVWADVAGDRDVNLLLHNDHPRVNPNTGKEVEGAGEAGTKRIIEFLASAERMPTMVSALRWGPNETWHDPARPSGYDLRDHLSQAGDGASARCRALAELVGRVRPVPPEWVPGNTGESPAGRMELELLPCHSWKELLNACIKALKWSDPYSRGLATIFACVVSTEQGGDDQLWVKLMSPPSSGKTTLAEAVSVNRRYVHPESKFQSMFSGYNDGSGTDYSLLTRVRGKTFVIKEGDSLLSNTYRDVILGQLRDIYDRVTRNSYGHNEGREYAGINISLVVCGTRRLEELDESDLGDRFLTVKMLDRVSQEDERDMMMRGIHAMIADIKTRSNGTPDSQDNPKRLLMKKLCGGYVKYLREHADALYGVIEPTDSQTEQLADLADLVAYMRSRPSGDDGSGEPVKELPTRLAKQLVRLAMSYAAVLGVHELDQQVMRWTYQAAIDTSAGHSFRICEYLAEAGKNGRTLEEISAKLVHSLHKDRDRLMFLARLGVCERVKLRRQVDTDLDGSPVYETGKGRQVWRLSPRMTALWGRIFNATAGDEESAG